MRMTLPAGVLLCVALAGCDRQSSTARAAPVVPSSPLDGIPDGPAPPVTIKASFQCPKPPVEGEPILPLDTPLTELQQLICAEPELALLDRQVHEAYLAARLRRGVDRAGLSKAEQQWKADRDTCLKASDPRDCVSEAIRTRLAELVLQDPTTVARTQLAFACKGTGTPLTAAFYSRLDPAFAVLGFGRERAIVFVEPNNAGLKYGRTGVAFFVRQGQVSAEFYGRTLACVSPSWRPSVMPAPVVAAQATDALVEQVTPAAPTATVAGAREEPIVPPMPTRSSAPAVPVTADQPMVAQVVTPAPNSPAPMRSASSTPAASTAPVNVAAAMQGPEARIEQATLPATSSASSAHARTPARLTAALATDALVRQVTSSHAPASSLTAPMPSSSPARSPVVTRSNASTKASQATDALVRQVVFQAQAVPVLVDAEGPAETPVPPADAGAQP
ncbi:hypothetical protein [Pseudoxanthomonas sp.]|uniref:hypothetical protein n=1 Tax=Pseudoxanthomonas sp. TaxID=1871049 RepID=UPI0026394417|nr:hypothetical protein [Pseudoxanthomonas sp.]WDS35343.1 MAG: hypothetical protein O8I58_13430 [Pseudoxanthomonas sp.]